MPVSFDVACSTGSYGIEIAPGLLNTVIGAFDDAVFVTDARFAERLESAGIDPVSIVAEESAKDIDAMADIVRQLRERGATRETMLVAVGGGVVQDIAAFVASIYMRGMAWTYLPTTMLAMTDSCIGGKSSINVGRYKNLVGTFHPPAAIRIDPMLTDSLPVEARAGGLVEAAKICFCRGADSFAAYLAAEPSVASDAETLADVIALSLAAKSWFIEIDEFDRAERLLLNFGHTFGHAIESASDFRISHGIAVGLGMLAALELGKGLGRVYDPASRVGLLQDHIRGLLARVDGLDECVAGLDPDALMDAFRSDKKHGRLNFAVIIVSADGEVERLTLARDEANETLLRSAFSALAVYPRSG